MQVKIANVPMITAALLIKYYRIIRLSSMSELSQCTTSRSVTAKCENTVE